MNYFIVKNKDILDYEIDSLSCLKRDISNVLNNDPKITILYNEEKDIITQNIKNKDYKLSVDFIGPSRHHAKCRKVKEDVILISQILSREIGGHIIFPSERFTVNNVEKSINEIRSYRFKERIDFFLFELKQWFGKNNKVKAAQPVFDGNKDWFSQFIDFKGYINYFKLNDFVNENYEVYDLSSYNIKNCNYCRLIYGQPKIEFTDSYPQALQDAYIPEDYNSYIEGCVFAIRKRTDRMLK